MLTNHVGPVWTLVIKTLVAQATASIFGTRVTTDTDSAALAKTVIYQAECDGFLYVQADASNANVIVTSSVGTPPTTVIGRFGYGYFGDGSGGF